MNKYRITGTKHGKLVTTTVQAPDHNAAVLAGSKGKLMLVVKSCMLMTAPAQLVGFTNDDERMAIYSGVAL